jgi:very-short-patch-repair endonuclease
MGKIGAKTLPPAKAVLGRMDLDLTYPPSPLSFRKGGVCTSPRFGKGPGDGYERKASVPVKNIVIGQKISPAKAARAREFRQNMTPAEKLLWQALRANRLNGFHFRRQQVIDGFIVDFYCHAASLVIEIDGDIHLQQVEPDRQRQQALTERGFRVIRFANDQIFNNLSNVLAQIQSACHAQKSQNA